MEATSRRLGLHPALNIFTWLAVQSAESMSMCCHSFAQMRQESSDGGFMSEEYYAEEHFGGTDEDTEGSASAAKSWTSRLECVMADRDYPQEHFGHRDEQQQTGSSGGTPHPHRANNARGTTSAKGQGEHSLPPGLARFEGMLATAGYGSSSPRESGFAFGEPFWVRRPDSV